MTTERWALVPVEPTQEALKAIRFGDQTNNRPTYAAVIAASPGAALLAEVLAARDAYLSAVKDGGMSSESYKNRSDTHFALFAALDKIAPWPHEDADKLGPAQPCQPGEHHE